ncbi:MAG: TldD/PmbA family protein [Candidatus Edwardsbacteria bacterium]
MNNLISKILFLIKDTKAEAGEVYFIDSQSTRIEIESGKPAKHIIEERQGVGIRILDKQRIGFAYTTDLTLASLKATVRAAYHHAQLTTPNPNIYLPIKQEPLLPLQIFDLEIKKISLEEKSELALKIESAAREFDVRITNFRITRYSDELQKIIIANTFGLNYTYQRTKFEIFTSPLAQEKEFSEIAYVSDYALRFRDLKPEDFGHQAAQKAILKLHATSYPTRKVDLIFSPEICAEFLEAVAPALFGENVMKGKSLFQNKIEKEIASPVVTLIDDGRLKDGPNTTPVDDEGSSTQKSILISEGKLMGFLHDTQSATHFKTNPTGNARRYSYFSLPKTSISNLYLKPQEISADDLISQVKDGLYISGLLGLHTINTISGDFSVGATGNIIKDGSIGQAVKGIALAGNIKDSLLSINSVANDLRFFPTGGGGSTVLISQVSVSGE